jgi:PAS domain S-box-containing protein
MEQKVDALNQTYVEKTIQYMSYHIYENPTLAEFAGEVNLCKCHFLRVFKTTTGFSPMNYFMKLKINKAAELLTTTNLSVGEIAKRLKFSNDSHCNRTFKKQKEINPSGFRRKYLQSGRMMALPEEHNQFELSYSMLRAVLDASPDLIFIKDVNDIHIECNMAFCRVMGLERGQIVGKTTGELFRTQAEAQFFQRNDQIVFKAKVPRRNREWMSLPDGTRKEYEVLKSPYFDGQGNAIGLIGISRDITDILEWEPRQRRAAAKSTPRAPRRAKGR